MFEAAAVSDPVPPPPLGAGRADGLQTHLFIQAQLLFRMCFQGSRCGGRRGGLLGTSQPPHLLWEPHFAAPEPSMGWPGWEPVPWRATSPLCLARAKLLGASISWAAFCCLLCPIASALIPQDEINLRRALPSPLLALLETQATESSGMLAFTCREGAPHAPFNKQSSASVLGFSPQRNIPRPGWAPRWPQAPTLPRTTGRGGGQPPVEQGWGFLMVVRGCSWGSKSI